MGVPAVMSCLRLLPLLLSLSLLSACDDKPAPPVASEPHASEEPARGPQSVSTPKAPVQGEPRQAPDELPPPGRKVVDDTSLPKPTQRTSKPVAKAPASEALPELKLDLYLPPELVEQLLPDEPVEVETSKPALLPQLFVEKPKEPGPFELNGRLITNERSDKEDYWDTVEGAELQFKFRN